MVVALWLVAGAAAAQPPAPQRGALPALSDEQRRILEEIPDEGTEPPGEHYYRSNEWRQDLLVPHLDGLGGAFVGVGADQNYTMAAMARSELLVLVDYDPFIPWIHAIYGVLIRESATPEELIARFAPENERATTELLRTALASHPRVSRVVRHFRSRRDAWHAYLRRVSRLVRDGRPFSWLSSSELYSHVRGLFVSGRVVSRNGDVTASQTMQGVAEACRRLGVPVRVVYFSNAEQFFEYTESFVGNMRALPTDDRSIVFRTIRHRSIPIAVDGQWHAVIQPFADFLDRLGTVGYRRSFALTTDLLAAGPRHIGANGISVLDGTIPRAAAEEAQERRRAREH